MLKAEDVMTRRVISVSPDTDIVAAAGILLQNRINGVPVVQEDGLLVGILCQSDLIIQQKKMPLPSLFTFLDGVIDLRSNKQMEREAQKIAAITVAQAMTAPPVTVKPDNGLETVAALMVDNNFHTLPVVDDEGRMVGIVGQADVLKTLIPSARKPARDD